jgi:hypothetical protein
MDFEEPIEDDTSGGLWPCILDESQATDSEMGAPFFLICGVMGLAVLGLYSLAYVSRCLKVVQDATAAGADEVHWPDEIIMDWALDALAYILVVAFLILQGVALTAGVDATIVPLDVGLRGACMIGLSIWICFPPIALSLAASDSGWTPLYPQICWRMLRLLPYTILFYLASGLVLAAALYSLQRAMFTSFYFLALAAPLASAMILIYARLLGLLAWKVGELGPIWSVRPSETIVHARALKDHPGPRMPGPPVDLPSPPPGAALGTAAHKSPTGMLDEENLGAFALAPDKIPEVQPKKSNLQAAVLDPEELELRKGFAVEADAAPPPTNPAPIKPRLRSKESIELLRRDRPAFSFLAIVGFPFYKTSLRAMAWLTFDLACVVLFFALVRAFLVG